jgi:hypothetical protein
VDKDGEILDRLAGLPHADGFDLDAHLRAVAAVVGRAATRPARWSP